MGPCFCSSAASASCTLFAGASPPSVAASAVSRATAVSSFSHVSPSAARSVCATTASLVHDPPARLCPRSDCERDQSTPFPGRGVDEIRPPRITGAPDSFSRRRWAATISSCARSSASRTALATARAAARDTTVDEGPLGCRTGGCASFSECTTASSRLQKAYRQVLFGFRAFESSAPRGTLCLRRHPPHCIIGLFQRSVHTESNQDKQEERRTTLGLLLGSQRSFTLF